MDDIQTWPIVRVATQNGEDNGTDVTSTPNVKQNEIRERESSEQTKKKGKRRTLKHLVRMCEEFGDNSDKSGILARWRKCLRDPKWHYAVDARLLDRTRMEDSIQQLVIKLENLYREIHNQGGASGKVRDVARERFWEASPLTRVENTLKKEALVPRWTQLQLDSWALYLESQMLFANLDIRICRDTMQFHELHNILVAQKNAEMNFLVEACRRSDIDLSENFDLTSNFSDSDSGHSDFEDSEEEDYRLAELTGYNLAANVTIPISRFTSRTCLELKRMSQISHGKARAFQLALMFRLDFLRFEKLKLNWWRKGVHETDALLLDLLEQEQKD
ncbi:hypothetical protein GT037_001984 [Alternaria burnsii]|uniref:Uncharacterized protein n=1 Tax=Alternaria burnsii TaxID=1187904 RepID=A0A8H7BBH7_9PLEO|nr:uncharacterized protein GT037_001984 [Alternaria burnsii]KAF7680333.1 hypothetical protein GT037_001984 [Alternaria burnsii]CAI9628607.1 unnamed protein product [Alternaria burnsii]